MPVPTSIIDIPTVDASAYPQGSESIGSPGKIDDYLRAGFIIQRQESFNKSWERADYPTATPTYVSASTFTLPMASNTRYVVGRRIKATVTAGTIYGVISNASTTGATTTVAVTWDSGSLDSGLSEVALGPDTNAVTPLNNTLTALSALTPAADKMPYFTGASAAGTTTVTSYIRTLLDDTDAATARTTLGLAIGTNVQAFDAELAALASTTSAADRLPYYDGASSATTTPLTSFARTFLDDTSASQVRTTLGAAASGANSDITGLSGITGALYGTVTNGGNAMHYVGGTSGSITMTSGQATEVTLSQKGAIVLVMDITNGTSAAFIIEYTANTATKIAGNSALVANGAPASNEIGIYKSAGSQSKFSIKLGNPFPSGAATIQVITLGGITSFTTPA